MAFSLSGEGAQKERMKAEKNRYLELVVPGANWKAAWPQPGMETEHGGYQIAWLLVGIPGQEPSRNRVCLPLNVNPKTSMIWSLLTAQ